MDRSAERDALLQDSSSSASSLWYGTEDQQVPIEDATERVVPNCKTYKRRFWILIVFSLLCCLQCVQWNTWGPISQSVEAAFEGWNASTVAMMGNWGTFTFVLFIFPMCYFIQTDGLRVGVLICATFMAVGTFLRCLTLTTPIFTILCHVCAFLVGTAGTVIMAAPPLVAAEWFPPHERTSATAFCQAMNQMGSVGSYLEPLIVQSPEDGVPVQNIRDQVKLLMNIMAICSAILLIAIVIYFPSRPPIPPSVSSSVEKFEFRAALLSMYRKRKFVYIWTSYSVFLGIPSAWLSVLNYSFLTFGMNQKEAMWVGIFSIFCSCLAAFIVGRFTDKFYGHVKKSILLLMTIAILSFTWFLLLSTDVIKATKWQIYASVIIGVSANFGTAPLYFELAVETAYPSPEGLVGGVVTGGNNLVGVFFLLLFFIDTQDYTWVTYCLVGGSIFSMFPLLLVKEDYARSSLDRRIVLPVASPSSEGQSQGLFSSRSSPGKLHVV